MGTFKRAAVLGVGALAGNFIADQFVLKSGEGDTGFIQVQPGFGLDDVVKALVVGVTILFVQRLV